jgi:hypothetical protein
MEYLVVGERWNMPAEPSWRDVSPERWYRIALRAGAFGTDGRYDRERLLSLGLDLSRTMNLTPPSPQEFRFDDLFALKVADIVLANHSLVVCIGKRVARAFGVHRTPFFRWDHGRIGVPHPSGLNRMWNEGIEEMQRACRTAGLVSGAQGADRDDNRPRRAGDDRQQMDAYPVL